MAGSTCSISALRSSARRRDNRGAMLRVVGQCQDNGTRIENRIGEPAANPYLYLASQIHAGLDGMARRLKAPPATNSRLSCQIKLTAALDGLTVELPSTQY